VSESGDGDGERTHTTRAVASRGEVVGFLLAAGLLVGLMLGGLGHPLIWQDEAETVMFGQRVLEHGYPRVHDGRNVVYGMGVPLEHAVNEADDAYLGSLWGQYYFAALGVALADSGGDPWARTARLRLPFALAGLLGLGLAFAAILSVLPRDRRTRLRAALLYCLLICTSTSLLLHLREVRYYALVIALMGASLCIALRLKPGRRAAVLQAFCLLLLFNVFYPAAVALGVWLALEAALRAGQREGDLCARVMSEVPLGLALAGVGLCALPLVAYFEILPLSRIMSERWQFGAGVYVENLGFVLRYLLRYEYLVPALLLHGGLLLLDRRFESIRETTGAPLARANALLRLCVCFVLIGARNPIYFERYFIPLSPLLALVLLLDFASLAGASRIDVRVGPLARAAIAVGFVSIAVVWGIKAPELRGQAHQLLNPYRGPLDHVIPDLIARYPDPADLTIATNYEAEAYMYYLGSRVVGRFHDADPQAIEAEAAVPVDVVIPRRLQTKNLRTLKDYVEAGRFRRVTYPVTDLPYNNIPELDPGRVLTQTHRFRSSRGEGEPPLEVYFRVAPQAVDD
jgi:hypothetical protein